MEPISLTPAELETILAVAREGSFRAAARSLNLAQPSVSSRIRRAEDILGVPLFHRSKRGITLTDHAERLCVVAERTLQALREAVTEIRTEARQQCGRIVVGATPTIAATLLPESIRRFTEQWHNVNVVLLDNFQGQALERVVSSAVDFAIVPYFQADSRLVFEPLFADELVLVGPCGHPLFKRKYVDLRSVASSPLITMSSQSALHGIVNQAFDNQGLKFSPIYEANETLALLAMVRAGHGVAFISKMLTPLLNLSGLELARVGRGGLYRHICLASCKGRVPRPSTESLMSVVRATGIRLGTETAACSLPVQH